MIFNSIPEENEVVIMKNSLPLFVLLISLILFLPQKELLAQYQIGSWTFNNSTGSSANVNFIMTSNMGEPVIGVTSNDQFTLKSGSRYSIGTDTVVTSIGNPDELRPNKPDRFALEQNYPNPFNPTTNIQFDLPQSTEVTLAVYNTLGQKVSTLIDKQMSAGSYSVQFEGAGLPSGVYIYRMNTESFKTSRKMLLVK